MIANEMSFETDSDLEIVFTINPGCKGDSGFRPGLIGRVCNPTPDEPACIEDLYVGVMVKGRSIDITKLLSEKERKHIEDMCWEHAKDSDRE